MTKAFTTDKTIAKYAALVAGRRRVWTKQEIHALTKLVNAAGFQERHLAREPLGTELRRLVDGVNSVYSALMANERPVKITPDHTRVGLAYLKRLAWCKDGTPRKRDPFGARERAVLLAFTHFTFDGWYTETGHTYEIVWRVHAGDASFSYVQRSGRWSGATGLLILT